MELMAESFTLIQATIQSLYAQVNSASYPQRAGNRVDAWGDGISACCTASL